MSHMNVYMDREFKKNPEVLKNFPDQPNLIEMTAKAIDILSKNPNGFYLMSEGACIDKQLHTMDWQRAAYDTIELDQAVAYATDWAKANGDDTLIVVIADHSHGVSLTGTYHEHDGAKGRDAVRTYAAAGWPTFADRNADGYPDDPDADVTLALQYANFPDHYENYRFQEKPTSPAKTARLSATRIAHRKALATLKVRCLRPRKRRKSTPRMTSSSWPAVRARKSSTV